MSDIDPTTVEPAAPGTGGDKPTATPTAPTAKPTATDDDVVTLNKEDYKNLLAQRDRANNLSSESESYVNTLAKREAIDSFLEDHKTEFPDVSREDLEYLEDPGENDENLVAAAKARQRRYEDVVQKKLLDVQKADTPVLSPEDRAAQLKQLKKNPGKGSFQKMLELQPPTK